MSASPNSSYSLPPDNSYDAFVYHITTALARQTPSGYAVDSDTNRDGEVDLQEAFDFVMNLPNYASFRQTYPDEAPHLEDNSSTNSLAERLTLNGLV
jgi:hypothetical protein